MGAASVAEVANIVVDAVENIHRDEAEDYDWIYEGDDDNVLDAINDVSERDENEENYIISGLG